MEGTGRGNARSRPSALQKAPPADRTRNLCGTRRVRAGR